MSEAQVVRAGYGEKSETVNAVHERLKSAKMAIVTEYRGLTVAQMTKLRREVRQVSGEYQVIKNTLVRRALKDTVYGDLAKLLEGPNGWVFAYDDPVLLTKTLLKFADDNDKLTIKGGVFEGRFMDSAQRKSSLANAQQAGIAGEVAGDDQRSGDSAAAHYSRARCTDGPFARVLAQSKRRITITN